MLTTELIMDEVAAGRHILFICCNFACAEKMFQDARPDGHRLKLCVWPSHQNISQGPAGAGKVQFLALKELGYYTVKDEWDYVTLCPCMDKHDERLEQWRRLN